MDRMVQLKEVSFSKSGQSQARTETLAAVYEYVLSWPVVRGIQIPGRGGKNDLTTINYQTIF